MSCYYCTVVEWHNVILYSRVWYVSEYYFRTVKHRTYHRSSSYHHVHLAIEHSEIEWQHYAVKVDVFGAVHCSVHGGGFHNAIYFIAIMFYI